MPTCPTCQGEYVRQECLCPACDEALGRGVFFCHSCGERTWGRRLCPCCRSDVVAWENERLTLTQFITRRGGFVGLLPTVGALLFFILKWAWMEDSIHHPIASIFSIILSLFVFYGLFSIRYGLRERAWAEGVYEVDGPPLPMLGVWAVGLGMLCVLMFFALYKVVEMPAEFPLKMIFAIVYIAAFVSLTTGLTIFVLQGYLAELNTRLPQPIFVHTDRLLRIVLQTVARTMPEKNAGGKTVNRDPRMRFEPVVVERIPSDGGIRILARECRFVRWPAPDDEPSPQWTEWVIDADRWGRLRSLKPRSSAPQFPPTIIGR